MLQGYVTPLQPILLTRSGERWRFYRLMSWFMILPWLLLFAGALYALVEIGPQVAGSLCLASCIPIIGNIVFDAMKAHGRVNALRAEGQLGGEVGVAFTWVNIVLDVVFLVVMVLASVMAVSLDDFSLDDFSLDDFWLVPP